LVVLETNTVLNGLWNLPKTNWVSNWRLCNINKLKFKQCYERVTQNT